MTKEIEFVKKKFEIDEDWQLALLGYPDWLQAMSEYAEQEAVAFSRWATGEPIKSELYSIYKQLTKQQ